MKKKIILILVVLIVLLMGTALIIGKNYADKIKKPDDGVVEKPAHTVPALLFYQNTTSDAYKADPCNGKSLSFVVRNEPEVGTLEATLKDLLRGALTDDEKKAGFQTEYPRPGLSLVTTTLKDGTLTLTFDDPQNGTTGGSCRVGILWAQIEKTALQFDGVRKVVFQPDTLFQP